MSITLPILRFFLGLASGTGSEGTDGIDGIDGGGTTAPIIDSGGVIEGGGVNSSSGLGRGGGGVGVAAPAKARGVSSCILMVGAGSDEEVGGRGGSTGSVGAGGLGGVGEEPRAASTAACGSVVENVFLLESSI